MKQERKVMKKKAKSKAVAVVKEKEPKSLLEVILQAAKDPRVDVGKMSTLMEMRREEEKRQAEIIFNNALADAVAELPPIVKDAKGDRNIRYASLVKVSNALDPLLRKYGFTLSFFVNETAHPDLLSVVGELRHRAGHRMQYPQPMMVSNTGPAGKPIMSKGQSVGAAVSFAKRYIKVNIFDIRIIDEGDAAAVVELEALSMDEVIALQKHMTKAKANTEKFCEYFGIAAVPELPKAKLPEATRILDRMIREFEGA